MLEPRKPTKFMDRPLLSQTPDAPSSRTCKARARVGFCEAIGNSHMFRGEVSRGDIQGHVYLWPSLSPPHLWSHLSPYTYVHTYAHTHLFNTYPPHLCLYLSPDIPMFIPMPTHAYVHIYPPSMFIPIPTVYVHTYPLTHLCSHLSLHTPMLTPIP